MSTDDDDNYLDFFFDIPAEPQPVVQVEVPSVDRPTPVTVGPTLSPEGHFLWSDTPREKPSPRRIREPETPVPAELQRTQFRGVGWSGYCADDSGRYIGGIGNDCRYYSPDHRRCAVHR